MAWPHFFIAIKMLTNYKITLIEQCPRSNLRKVQARKTKFPHQVLQKTLLVFGSWPLLLFFPLQASPLLQLQATLLCLVAPPLFRLQFSLLIQLQAPLLQLQAPPLRLQAPDFQVQAPPLHQL